MKRSLLLLLALVGVASCESATTEPPAVVIVLTPSTANANCVVASPDPANIRAGQAVAFRNGTSMSHTILADGINTPWTVVGPDETSGSIDFPIASTRKYYVQACGSASANLHSIVVTVN